MSTLQVICGIFSSGWYEFPNLKTDTEMISTILNNLSQFPLEARDPEERFITSGVSWEADELLLESLGDCSKITIHNL